MEKVFKKDVHTGYEIGEHIQVHGHINDPESWFVTIRPLEIFGESLCKKTCTEPEIARYVYLMLKKRQGTVNALIIALLKDIHPFT